jgi:hypothetical protein
MYSVLSPPRICRPPAFCMQSPSNSIVASPCLRSSGTSVYDIEREQMKKKRWGLVFFLFVLTVSARVSEWELGETGKKNREKTGNRPSV